MQRHKQRNASTCGAVTRNTTHPNALQVGHSPQHVDTPVPGLTRDPAHRRARPGLRPFSAEKVPRTFSGTPQTLPPEGAFATSQTTQRQHLWRRHPQHDPSKRPPGRALPSALLRNAVPDLIRDLTRRRARPGHRRRTRKQPPAKRHPTLSF